jgi:hypothetical protein
VRGRELVRLDTGASIRLRGVNRSGLEYADPGPAGRGAAAFLDSVAFDEADLRRIAAWGANVVRVPFTQEFVLGGRGAATGADYLAALDQVVTWAEACGVYTLLDLQWIDADTPHGIGQDGPSPGAGVAPGLRPPGRGVSGLRGGLGRRAVRRRLGPPAARLSRGDDGGLDGVELVRLAAAAGGPSRRRLHADALR